MKLIILRGLPGCGKSTIAKKLGENLNSDVVNGDVFKLESLEKNKSFEEALLYSYKKIFKKIKMFFAEEKEFIIVEELFYDKNLIDKIKDFCEQNNVKIYWFFIGRNIKEILEVEKNRDRKIKNSEGDFEKLKQKLEDVKIKDEVFINNNEEIDKSVKLILEKI